MKHIHRFRRALTTLTRHAGHAHPVISDCLPTAASRRRRRLIVALGALLTVTASLGTAAPALARGGGWQVYPAAPFTLPATYCGFPIAVSYSPDNEYIKLLTSTQGSAISLVTGNVTASYTNVVTGKTVTENESGPGTLTQNPDGSVTEAAKGTSAFYLTPAEAQRFGMPAVGVSTGALTATIAADGTVTTISLNGHIAADVCVALS